VISLQAAIGEGATPSRPINKRETNYMAICQIMTGDYLYGWGRYDEITGQQLYSDDDLIDGIAFAEDLIEQGYEETPTPPVWNLKGFVEWAKTKLERR
jgi:hypothetical protein